MSYAWKFFLIIASDKAMHFTQRISSGMFLIDSAKSVAKSDGPG